MRVGVVGPLELDSFADNLLSTLPRLGHLPVALGPAIPRPNSPYAKKAWMVLSRFVTFAGLFQRRLVELAQRNQVEVVISTQAGLLPSTVSALRQVGCKTVLWFPDAVAYLDRQLMLAADYDAVFFKDRLLVDRLRSLTDAPVHYLPEACNPAWHQPGPCAEVEPVIVVAGNLYPSRVLVLEKLHRAGVPLRLYSSEFPRWIRGFAVQSLPVRPPIYREAKAEIFRRAAAVLNNLHPGELDSVNCRLFEAAGCGAAVLCEERPVLGELFERGREVLSFVTFDELMDHVHTLLTDFDTGTSLGDAAATRAHAQHTYDHRLRELFGVLGAKAPKS